MSNSDRGNEPGGPGPLDVKKLQDFFTSSESIVLEGLDVPEQRKGAAVPRAERLAGKERGSLAGPDPMRPLSGAKKGATGEVFAPASPGEVQPREKVESRRVHEGTNILDPVKRPGKSMGRGGESGTRSGREAAKAGIPPTRDPSEHPRQFAEDVNEVTGDRPQRVVPSEKAVAGTCGDTGAPKVRTASAADAGSAQVGREAASTFSMPVEMRERWGLGAPTGRNRQHVSPVALVGCAVLIQTGITLLVGALFWKAFASPWVERQIAARTAASGSVALAEGAGAADASALESGTSAAADALVREEALLVLSTLADHALVTGERRFLDEFRNTYQSGNLDRLVHRFAVAREGAVLAAFRDRPARYALQVDAVLPDSGKTRESQLTAAELTSVLTDERRTRIERARAAYLLRSTRDYQVVDQIAEVLRNEQDLEVLVNALYAFLAITACDEVEGFDVARMLEWWNRNRTDLLAGSTSHSG